jgi:hypothetical protein
MKRFAPWYIPGILICLFIIAVVLRYWGLPKYLFFGPEQGIDFKVLRDMVVSHKFTLIGSKTDIDGIYHGPLFHYLALIPFVVSRGSPLAVAFFMIVLNSLSVFLLYLVGKELYTKRVGLLAALVFTFSISAIIMSRWLKEMPLSIPLSCLFFYFVAKFSKGKTYGLYGAAIVYGLLGQAEFLNYILFAGVGVGVVILLFSRVRQMKRSNWIIFFVLIASASWGNFFLFDIRHDFLIVKNIYLLATGSSHLYSTYLESFYSFLNTFPAHIRMTVAAGVPTALVGILILMLTYVASVQTRIHKGIFFLWIILPFVILFFLRRGLLDQFYVATIPGVILLAAVAIDYVWKRTKVAGYIVCGVVFILGIGSWQYHVVRDNDMFFKSVQPGVLYEDERAVIDALYTRSHGEPFSFQPYTIPYWYQHGWEYLLWYRGFQTYGYLPVQEKASTLYVVVQDDASNKQFQNDWLTKTVSTWGDKKDEFRIGVFRVLILDAHI